VIGPNSSPSLSPFSLQRPRTRKSTTAPQRRNPQHSFRPSAKPSSPMNVGPATPNPNQARGVSVEEIVSGTRCSPLTLKEFEGFLIHVSRLGRCWMDRPSAS